MSNGYLKFFVPYVIIQSFSYSFAKDSLNYASPFVFMALRYFLAGSLLVIAARKFTLNRSTLLIAIFTTASTLTWIGGLEYVSAGDSAVLNSTTPLFAIPIAFFVLKEKPAFWEIGGLVIGFLGILIYSYSLAHGSLLIGVLSTLAASATSAAFSVLFRRARNENTASIVGSQYMIGSVFFALGAFFYPQVNFAPGFFTDLLYLAIPAGAIQLYFWSRMLTTESVAKMTTMLFAIPVLAVAIQSIETFALPGYIALIGAGIMFVGIYISSKSRLRVDIDGSHGSTVIE